MSTAPDARTRGWPPRRWALWGFVVGAAITVPATMFALLSYTGETLYPFLVPSSGLLTRLGDVVATWPGALNMAIACGINGLFYAAIAGALGALVGMLKHR